MSRYEASIIWQRNEQPFTDNRYSRAHRWRFDGGIEITASSSPQVVPLPLSLEAAVDPEEAFVAALASCHMLWFLSIAAKRGFRVDSYTDAAEGFMAKNAEGRLAMTRVSLHPDARFSGERLPDRDTVIALHAQAHAECFIAHSVRSEVIIAPVFGDD